MTDSTEKTVYLLGAGASANTLPVAEQMPDDMESLAEKVEHAFPGKSDFLVNGIRMVAKKAKEHGSVDQYAYELSKADDHKADGRLESEDYQTLRFMLTAYMLLKQVYNAPVLDERYQAWLDSVCSPKHSFSSHSNDVERRVSVKAEFGFIPEDIYVLTYNYDFQMEMAFYQSFLCGLAEKGVPFFSPENEVRAANSTDHSEPGQKEMLLNIFGVNRYNQPSAYGMLDSLPTVCFHGEIKDFDIERYFYVSNWSCIHLNGVCDTAGKHSILWGTEDRTAVRKMMRAWDTFNLPASFREKSKEKYITYFMKAMEEFNSGQLQSIKPSWNLFGWDMHQKFSWTNSNSNYLEQKIGGAKNLVVIGYSFPEFNRWMDMGIFNSLKNGGKFERIYIQNPGVCAIPDLLLRAAGNVEIIEIKDVQNFFIPDALRS